MKDYYAILEVPRNATSQDIKKAWREQLQVWHPDRFMNNPSLRAKAESKAREINEAHEILGNDESRRTYDDARQNKQEPQDNSRDNANLVSGTELIVPFILDLQAIEKAASAYMAEGEYTPDNLVQIAKVTKLERLYLPCYYFHGLYLARWTATFGFDRTEHYTAYETRISSDTGRTRQVPVTKTRTVTDWRSQSGTASGRFAVLTYAGAKFKGSFLPLIENSNGLEVITGLDPSTLEGFEIEQFTVSEEDAYKGKADPTINKVIDESVRKHAQGDRQRDWHWNADLERRSNKILMPIGHATFEFEKKQFNLWIDGTNPKRRLGDALPKDKEKVLAVIWGFTPAFASFVSVVVSYVIFRDSASSILAMCVPAGCLILGFLRRKSLIAYSKSVRQHLLEAKVGARKVEWPRKPFFANTSKDRKLFPILVVILPFCILLAPWVKRLDVKEEVMAYLQQWGVSQPISPPPAIEHKTRTPQQVIEDERVRQWREK